MNPPEAAIAPCRLLLLPGLDGTDVFLRPLRDRLPADIAVSCVELPDAGPYSYAELLALVRARVHALGDCHVLATSFSGPLAVMLAEAEPARVRGLVLVATFLRSPRPALRRWRFVLAAPLVWSLRTLRRLPVWARPRDDAMRVAKRETWARVSARALAQRARAVLIVDVRESMRRLRQPVLAVAYDEDAVVAPRWSGEIADHGRKVTRRCLRGGHHGMFEDAAPLAAAVAAFLQLPAATSSPADADAGADIEARHAR